MKKIIFLSVLSLLVLFGSLNGQGGPVFGSDSPFEESNQNEEQMDRTSVLTADESKKANNRGGQGGAGGFATFNTNTKDVPIDNGVILVVIALVGYGVIQIQKKLKINADLNMNV